MSKHLSPDSAKRLMAQELELRKRFGATSGLLISAYASSLFAEAQATVSDAEKVTQLLSIIEHLFKGIVPRLHPDGRVEIVAATQEFLTSLFAEAHPDVDFAAEREAIDEQVRKSLH